MGLKEDMAIVAIIEELEEDSSLANYASRNRPHLWKWRRDERALQVGEIWWPIYGEVEEPV